MKENITPETLDYLVGIARSSREHLHAHPELRWEEEYSLGYVLDEIKRAMARVIEARNGEGRKEGSPSVRFRPEFTGGLVVDVTINNKQRTLVRADIDALPLQEYSGLPFASHNAGVMHACGHDLHTSWLLAALVGIIEGLIIPARNLRFVFQRAEENPTTESGGACLVREGVCKGVQNVVGLHVLSTAERGTFFSREGLMMGNSDRFYVNVETPGGHIMNSAPGKSASTVGAEIITVLCDKETVETIGGGEFCILDSTGCLAGNESTNILPQTARIPFGFRHAFDAVKRQKCTEWIDGIIQGVANQYEGVTAKLEYHLGHPRLENNPAHVCQMATMLVMNDLRVGEQPMSYGGEDFAHYLNSCPGSFWFLGAANPEQENGPADHHTPKFNPADVYEEALRFWNGVITAPADISI